MRVLTYNSHQPYIHLLASLLPWELGVITPRSKSGIVQRWNPRIRPLPANIKLYTSTEEALLDTKWDWILTHSVSDLIDSINISMPKVFLIHGTLSGRIIQDNSNIDRRLYIKNLQILLRTSDTQVVYISELKRRDWELPGEVIRSTVDTRQYGGYRGSIRGILQICNRLKERGVMMGYQEHQSVCRDLPHLVLGENGILWSSRRTEDWKDLKDQLCSYRVYLYTAQHPYEDGYNLSLLEAMATGMPVATLKHPTSPIRDDSEGVVASNAEELRERVIRLLDMPGAASRMGKAARIRVESEFPVRTFQYAWESLAAGLSC